MNPDHLNKILIIMIAFIIGIIGPWIYDPVLQGMATILVGCGFIVFIDFLKETYKK